MFSFLQLVISYQAETGQAFKFLGVVYIVSCSGA